MGRIGATATRLAGALCHSLRRREMKLDSNREVAVFRKTKDGIQRGRGRLGVCPSIGADRVMGAVGQIRGVGHAVAVIQLQVSATK